MATLLLVLMLLLETYGLVLVVLLLTTHPAS
jgi:hypothetical protein